jgi:hypothetical protein
MKKNQRPAPPELDPGPLVVAMTLANELATEVEADAAHRQELIGVALDVGQWLSDQGRPGRWDTIDPAAVLAMTVPLDVQARNGYLLAMAGLVGFASLSGYVPVAAARRTLEEIQGLATMPVVAAYTVEAIGQLEAAAVSVSSPAWPD